VNDLSKLPRDLQDYIDIKIQSGEFAGVLDVVATALAEMREREEPYEEDIEALRREIDLGIADDDAGRYSDLTVMQIAEQTRRKMEGR